MILIVPVIILITTISVGHSTTTSTPTIEWVTISNHTISTTSAAILETTTTTTSTIHDLTTVSTLEATTTSVSSTEPVLDTTSTTVNSAVKPPLQLLHWNQLPLLQNLY
jgi:hypothetical protein